jgi:hypothetical protein
MSPFRRPELRFRRLRRGVYQLRLPPEERSALRTLCEDVRAVLASGDASTRRLFPPGHAEDPVASHEFQAMVHDDLMASHLGALDTMEQTIDATRLNDEQAAEWLAALNQIRLVLGTRLDVTEELYEAGLPPDDPRGPGMAMYHYLGLLQEQAVEAVAAGLADPGARDRSS